MTSLLGLLCFLFLVDNLYSPLLRPTEEERDIAEECIQDNAVVRHRVIKWDQCLKRKVLFLSLELNLLKNLEILQYVLRKAVGESILLKTPGGVSSVIGVLVATILARRTRQICFAGVFMLTISLVGCIILGVAEQGPAELAGFYLAWLQQKIFYNGGYLVFYTLGNFIGPLVMLEREVPRYTGAMTGFCIGNGIAIVAYFLMRYIMARENRDRLANPPSEPTDVTLDLTDKQDGNFIYRL
ncbi:hypothetical protein BJV82DRAFT_663590 [Fennellomyces sp. T-0311]|nr:hypothetical protein BJV82DRAFT_663590 [Fennellomyces sp. T-0311]